MIYSNSNASYSSSNDTEGPCQSQSQTRLGRRRFYEQTDAPFTPSKSGRSQLRRRDSAPPPSTLHWDGEQKHSTTVYPVPHYAFGDPNPCFESNLGLPKGFEVISHYLEEVYRGFRTEMADDDPDRMRRLVSGYLIDANTQISRHRDEQIQKGVLPSNAEAVLLQLAPEEDREKLRRWIDVGLYQTNEGEETCDQSEHGKAEGDDGSTGGTCPEAEARYARIQQKLGRS